MKSWIHDNNLDSLDKIVEKYKYNKTYYRRIKIRPTDVKLDTYTEYGIEYNGNDPKFKSFDHVRISKYKNIFAKGYTPNWSEKSFVIKKVKITVPWT